MNETDMYGNEIYRLGETGYGVSVAIVDPVNGAPRYPFFTIFHASDGFRQSLLSVSMSDAPTLSNIFEGRLAEILSGRPHG